MFGFGKKKIDMNWANLVFAQPIEHPEVITKEKLLLATERQVTRRCEIILESVGIIRETKNENTRQGRVELCKKHIAYLEQLKPYVNGKQCAMIWECEKELTEIGVGL